MVALVKDHILGPLQFAKANRVGNRQPVVQRIGRARPRLGRLRRPHREVNWRDVNLVQHLVAVLQPADVDRHRHRQQQAQHHLVGAGAIAQPDQPVGHHQHDDRAHQPLGNRAAPAAKTVAAHHRRCKRGNLQPLPGAGAGAAEPRADQETGNRRSDAGKHVSEKHHPPHLDAGVVGRAPRAPYRQHMPAGAGSGQRDMGHDRQHHSGQDWRRKPQKQAVADKIPDRRRGLRGLHK